MPTDPYGWTIFCDDIRQEVGGKASLMGVYRGILFVHSAFPVTMPKFGLAVSYRIHFDDTRLEDVRLDILLPGDDEIMPTAKAVIPVSQMIAEDDPPTSPGDTFREFHANIILSPLILKEKGKISVRAIGGAGLIKLGTLKVDEKPASDEPASRDC